MNTQCLSHCREVQTVIEVYRHLEEIDTLGRYTLGQAETIIKKAYEQRLTKPPYDVTGKETSGDLRQRLPWLTPLIADACAEYLEDTGINPDIHDSRGSKPYESCLGPARLLGKNVCGAFISQVH